MKGKKHIPVYVLVCIILVLLVSSCVEKRAGNIPINTTLKKQIELGEKLFQDKGCGTCHTTTGDFGSQDTKAPDLASVFLSMDNLFIKRHLQFLELSAMPSIQLTIYEINALTQYISILHARAHMDSTLKEPDTICPISGAPLKKSVAEMDHLKVNYKGKDYYFVSPDAKVVFMRDPEWHSQSEWLQTERGVLELIE